jgi:hypothetical protein
LFPADNWWNLDISSAPLDAKSSEYISFFYPDNDLNWRMSADFGDNYGVPYVTVSGDHPTIVFSHIYYSAQSDNVPYPIPMEALTQPGWTQDLTRSLSDQIAGGYDRHMCIVDVDNHYLYEMYQPFYNAGTSAVLMYDFLVYPGEYAVGSCRRFDLTANDTSKSGSTNAAGMAFLPGHFLYDEVMGPNPIAHALNLTLNFSTKYAPYYVFPATDYAPGSAVSPVPGENGIGHPPFGARFRLKSSYVPLYNDPYANKVIQCLKTYGCFFMDNGPNGMIAGGQDDRWGNYETYPRNYIGYELHEVKATDFEIVELGWLGDSSFTTSPSPSRSSSRSSSASYSPTLSPSRSGSPSVSGSLSSSRSASASEPPPEFILDVNGPSIMLQYSDDGGHTWSNELWVSAGDEGAYKWRAIWRRLGKSRDRVWRVVVTDAVPWRFLDAYVQIEKGTS